MDDNRHGCQEGQPRERGQAAVRQLREQGLDAAFLPLDVTDQSSIDAAASAVEVRPADGFVDENGIVAW
ncbi:hypothetical protein [Dactylosporangium sp. CA-233914]|uniref:hypothetical protein n=1 Tax=Dactylosporangium sp. CA-233914 TaxID=3239934 RepID=UPI003D8ABB86